MSAFFAPGSERTTTGSSSEQSWPGGVGTFWADGDFGETATVALQFEPLDASGKWFNVGSAAIMSGKSAVQFDLGACNIRAHVSDGGVSGQTFSIIAGVL